MRLYFRNYQLIVLKFYQEKYNVLARTLFWHLCDLTNLQENKVLANKRLLNWRKLEPIPFQVMLKLGEVPSNLKKLFSANKTSLTEIHFEKLKFMLPCDSNPCLTVFTICKICNSWSVFPLDNETFQAISAVWFRIHPSLVHSLLRISFVHSFRTPNPEPWRPRRMPRWPMMKYWYVFPIFIASECPVWSHEGQNRGSDGLWWGHESQKPDGVC